MSVQRHHFYPAFCLRRWKGPDGRLQFFEQLPGNQRIVSGRASPERICREADLYSFQYVRQELKHVLEKEFITAEIDTPASEVLRLIEDKGLRTLSRTDRRSWARFVLSLPARSPEAMNKFGPEIARRLIDQNPAAYRILQRTARQSGRMILRACRPGPTSTGPDCGATGSEEPCLGFSRTTQI
jgi:hypothetical protein